jgi:hypothetical protein
MVGTVNRRWAHLHQRLVIQILFFICFFALIVIFELKINYCHVPTNELRKKEFGNLKRLSQINKLQLSENLLNEQSELTTKIIFSNFQHNLQVSGNSKSKKKCPPVSPMLGKRLSCVKKSQSMSDGSLYC